MTFPEPSSGPRANEFPTAPINYFAEAKDYKVSAEDLGHSSYSSPMNTVNEVGPGLADRKFVIEIPAANWTKEVEFIFYTYLADSLRLFAAKSRDYTDADGLGTSARLGVPGQWLKLLGKVEKLKRPLWDDRGVGEEFAFESVQEVLDDLIGHVLLTKMHYGQARTEMARAGEKVSEQVERLREMKEQEQNSEHRNKIDRAREALTQALFEANSAQEAPIRVPAGGDPGRQSPLNAYYESRNS